MLVPGLIEYETGFLDANIDTCIHLFHLIRPLISSTSNLPICDKTHTYSYTNLFRFVVLFVDNRWNYPSLSLSPFIFSLARICFLRNDKVILETDPSVSYIIVSTSALINSRLVRSRQRSKGFSAKRNSPDNSLRRRPRSLPLSLSCRYDCWPSSFAFTRHASAHERIVERFNRASVFGVNETDGEKK